MDEIMDKTRELAQLLRSSPEYAEFCRARDAAFKSASIKTLLGEYRLLQQKLQAAEISGEADEAELLKLQKLGELLQLDPAASEYLFAEYRLSAALARIYRTLAEAVDADLSLINE